MVSKKPIWGFIILLVFWTCLIGIFTPVSAETLNFKAYGYPITRQVLPTGNVEGHDLVLASRGEFLVFENGDVATAIYVMSADFNKGVGPYVNYKTIKFVDGSTIFVKTEGVMAPTGSKSTSEIIRGTGRFEGAKGTMNIKAKWLPAEKGEIGTKGIGEGTLTYTLPSK